MTLLAQKQKLFHRDERHPFTSHLPPPPSEDLRRWKVNPANSRCPLSRYVGQPKAKKKLSRAAFDALGRYNHVCRELAWFFSGPSSVGKTTLARLFAELLELPCVEISPRSIGEVHDILMEIARALDREGLPLVEVKRANHYILPPVVIFIDEVHALKPSVVDGLLKATEYKDAILVTEKGVTVDCYNVTWIIATTEVGDLFDAFDNRFCEVQLEYPSKADITKVVKLNNPDWSDEVCALVAHYRPRIPRKALEFAREMRLSHALEPHRPWADVAREVAADNSIDEHGMHQKQLAVLTSLAERPVAKDRLPVLVGVKRPELEKRLLPVLLATTADQPALVQVTGEGYALTAAGREELSKRGLALAA